MSYNIYFNCGLIKKVKKIDIVPWKKSLPHVKFNIIINLFNQGISEEREKAVLIFS